MPAYKRGEIWNVRFEVDGQKFTKSLGPTATKADAVAYEAKIRSEILAGKLGKKLNYTIDQAVERWLSNDASRLRSYYNLQNQVASMLDLIDGKPLTSIVLVSQAVKQAGLERGLAASTINKRVAILRRVANLAFTEWEWLTENLGAKIKTLNGEVRRDLFLTPAQVEHLAECCNHETVAMAIRLYARTGLRENELLKATEIRDGCIVVVTYKGRKGEKRTRMVPVPDDMPDLKLPIGITYNTLRHYFERARIKAEMSEVRIHDLRHTAASWWAQSGASLVTLRDLLGHTTFAETTRYSHLLVGDLKKSSEAMGKHIRKK